MGIWSVIIVDRNQRNAFLRDCHDNAQDEQHEETRPHIECWCCCVPKDHLVQIISRYVKILPELVLDNPQTEVGNCAG